MVQDSFISFRVRLDYQVLHRTDTLSENELLGKVSSGFVNRDACVYCGRGCLWSEQVIDFRVSLSTLFVFSSTANEPRLSKQR